MKYFTEKEVQDFKDGSINYPLIMFEKKQNQVIEVSEVVAISGMNINNGIPLEIKIQVHKKGKETEHLKYRLVSHKEVKMEKEIIQYLWNIIDDIDSASDIAKDNDKMYRDIVSSLQNKRWNTGIIITDNKINLSKMKIPN